jgi:methionine sulfoxide reductase catalytic subunit
MPLDFPLWLRATHILNILFLSLLARSGLEILSAHPKLYWNDDCAPGGEWLRFTRKQMPNDELWTSRDEEESFSSWIALPGRRNLGLGRHWHFASVIAWLLTGIFYVGLLFATDEWRRLIPTTWSVFPDAWDAFVAYLRFTIPASSGYNGLQQLAYFGVVFLLSPFMLATGAAMSPAIEAQFPRYPALFGGHQRARSLHFLSLLAFAAFTVVHTMMVVAHGLPKGLDEIVLGADAGRHTRAIVVGVLGLVIVVLIHVIGTRFSLRSPRAAQHILGAVVDPAQRLLTHAVSSRQQYARSAISPYFRVNGPPPGDAAYEQLARDGFAGWALEVGGMVKTPLRLSLADLRALPKQSQITMHHCIQGWSNVGEWAGTPMRILLDRCEPLPAARYVVFHALDEKSISEPDMGAKGRYYEAIDLALAYDPQTILAYEMNGAPLTVPHGAPVRLRLETQLGFKMVKYLRSIELVDDYRAIGDGQGGWREDVQHYSREVGI